jgi:hypothetical protein
MTCSDRVRVASPAESVAYPPTLVWRPVQLPMTACATARFAVLILPIVQQRSADSGALQLVFQDSWHRPARWRSILAKRALMSSMRRPIGAGLRKNALQSNATSGPLHTSTGTTQHPRALHAHHGGRKRRSDQVLSEQEWLPPKPLVACFDGMALFTLHYWRAVALSGCAIRFTPFRGAG